MSWATHAEVVNHMPTMDDVKQHLALVYPAEYGLSAANFVIQTVIAGPGGTVNAVKGEVIGRLMTAAVGDEINQGIGYAIELKAKAWMEYDKSLHPVEAMNLAVAGVRSCISCNLWPSVS
jgi:hypothetical protein